MLDNPSWARVSGEETSASRNASVRELPECGHEKTRTVRSEFLAVADEGFEPP